MRLFFCLSAPAALAGVRCGMAEGYPPFQFVEQGQPTGFDVAVLQLVAQKAGLALQLEAGRWDDIVARGRLGQYDCVAGMEITPARQRWFRFTQPYYLRRSGVFVRSDDSHLKGLADLIGGIISGDRDSALERELDELGIKHRIRIRQLASKEQSMQLLRDGKLSAVVMPDAVAYRLAAQLGVDIRPLRREMLQTAPVAIAVPLAEAELLPRLQEALDKLQANGELARLWRKYCPACGALPAGQ